MNPNPFDPQQNMDNLLREIGVDKFPPDKKELIANRLAERIQNIVLMTAIDLMTPEQKKEMELALKDPATRDEKLFILGASIPFLGEHIELALKNEINEIKFFIKQLTNN